MYIMCRVCERDGYVYSVYMCVCVRTRMCVSMCVYTYVCSVCTFTYGYVRIGMYTRGVHMCVFVPVDMCVRVCDLLFVYYVSCVCVRVYVCSVCVWCGGPGVRT